MTDEKLIEVMLAGRDGAYRRATVTGAIAALTAAGYRIVPEGGDAEALAEAAERLRKWFPNVTTAVKDHQRADVEAFDAALSAYRSGGGWRPASEAPKDGTRIVGWEPRFYKGPLTLFWDDGHWREPAHGLGLKWDITHWRPLPPAPDREGE